MSDLFNKQGLRMKQKNGVIPKSIWNRLVDVVYSFSIQSVVGGRLERNENGTALIIDGKATSGGGGAVEECVELKPALFVDENDVTTLRVSSGYVKNEIPEINGAELNADPPPAFTVSAAGTLWLKADFVPETTTVDNNGTTVYLLADGGVTENAEFVFTTTDPVETLPSVDPTSGAVTNGLVVMRWADVVALAGGGFKISVGAHCGNIYFSICSNTYHAYFYTEVEGDGGGGGLPTTLNYDDGFGLTGTLTLQSGTNYFDSVNSIDLFYDTQYGEWIFDGYAEWLVDPTGLSPQGIYSSGTVIS